MGVEKRRDQTLTYLRSAAEPVTIADVADHLGTHRNTARFHLNGLVKDGLAETITTPNPTSGRGRPTAHYKATTGMDPTGPTDTHLLVDIALSGLKNHPDPTLAARQLGHQWATAQHTTPPATSHDAQPAAPHDVATTVTHILDQHGFAPHAQQVSGHPGMFDLTLNHCPFLPLLSKHADVICPMHHGILQGTAQALNSHAVVENFTPFATPATCTARLHTPHEKDNL